jgi:2-oxo-hept-3-ene-1,7-dioate hydratase
VISLSDASADAVVAALEAARLSGKQTRMPSAVCPGLTLDDAYTIQRRWTAARIAAGARRIGYKVSFTTPAQQKALGTDRPAFAPLLDDMRFAEGEAIPRGRMIAPRIEAELAFVMGHGLAAPCSDAEALAAAEWAVPAIEIIDNRAQPRDAATGLTRTARDIIADGGATAGLVLSRQWLRPDITEFHLYGAVLRQNGVEVGGGGFDAIFGRPERALSWLAGELGALGEALEPGDIVLTGSVNTPHPAAPGDRFEADFGPFGSLALAFE